jgi:hypothetical protein
LHTRRLVVAISFLAVIAMACGFGVDTDTWWHLRAGQWILEHNALPNIDIFSFTRQGAAWHYPGWLAEVGMAALYQVGGVLALNAMTVVCVFLTFLVIFRTMEGDPYLQAFLLVLTAAASAMFWSARPQIFSLLLSAVFFLDIRQFIWKNRNRLWHLPILMALWVNLHGGFAIGFIFLALAVVGQAGVALFAPALGRAGEWKKLFWLVGISAACVIAVGANPYGYEMLGYPFQTVSMRLLQQYIQEWQSPDFHLLQAQAFLWLLLATFLAIAIAGKRIDFRELVFLGVAGYLGFLSARNIELLVVVAPAICMKYADTFLKEQLSWWTDAVSISKPSRKAMIANAAIIVVLGAAVGMRWWIENSPAAIAERIEKQVPVEAVAWLKTHPPHGNLLNAYNWGAYLMWEMPDQKVFIDGRTDVYGDEMLAQYLDLVNASRNSSDLLERWDIQSALLTPDMPLVQKLIENHWIIAYQDAQAVILERPR